MNIFRTFLVAALLVSASSVYGQKTAGEYIGALNAATGTLRQDTWDYMSAVANNRSARKIDKRRTELLATISAARTNVKKFQPWEGDVSLRDSMSVFLTFTHNMLTQDYAKIIDMEAVAEQSYDAMEAYILAQQMASARYRAASASLNATTHDFGEKYNVNIIENDDKLSKKIARADTVMKYYNKMFLAMFRAKVDEEAFISAINKNDVAGAQQINNKLLESAKESLKNIGAMQSFEGDASVKTATLELVQFYKSESETKFPVMLDFLLKKENFEKMKAAMDAKPANKRTKEEVDAYNKAVTEYNDAVNKYNATNTEVNTKRGQLVDAWNKTCETFTSKNVANR